LIVNKLKPHKLDGTIDDLIKEGLETDPKSLGFSGFDSKFSTIYRDILTAFSNEEVWAGQMVRIGQATTRRAKRLSGGSPSQAQLRDAFLDQLNVMLNRRGLKLDFISNHTQGAEGFVSVSATRNKLFGANKIWIEDIGEISTYHSSDIHPLQMIYAFDHVPNFPSIYSQFQSKNGFKNIWSPMFDNSFTGSDFGKAYPMLQPLDFKGFLRNTVKFGFTD